jgi:hypothetical protein
LLVLFSSLVGLTVLPSVALAGRACSPGAAAPNLKHTLLSGKERRALRLVGVCITDSGFGAIVDATFAGNVDKLIGKGGLRGAAIGLVFEPKAAGAAPLVVATTGPSAHPVAVRSKTLASPAPIVRHGATVTFFIRYAHVDQLKRLAVVLHVRGSSRGTKAGAGAPPGIRILTAADFKALDQVLPVGFGTWDAYGEISFQLPDLADSCDELKSQIDGAKRLENGGRLRYLDYSKLVEWLSSAEAEYKARPCPPPTAAPMVLYSVQGSYAHPAAGSGITHSNACTKVTSKPAQPGAKATVTLTRLSDHAQQTQEVTLDTSGSAEPAFTITQSGDYQIDATITGPSSGTATTTFTVPMPPPYDSGDPNCRAPLA